MTEGVTHGVGNVQPLSPAVCSPAVTHGELSGLLDAYAAGMLDGEAAAGVRAHLAEGCAECLGELYRRPVGLPVRLAPALRVPALTPEVVGPERPRPGPLDWIPWIAGALMSLALACVLLFVWTTRDLRARERAARGEAARLGSRVAALEVEIAGQRTRFSSQGEALDTARAEIAQQAEALQAAAAARTESEAALSAARDRVEVLGREVRRRETALARLTAAGEAEGGLRELVATPGVRLLPLAALAPFRAPHGHVVWQPSRETVVVYAFDLPQLPGGGRYRVVVTGARASPGTATLVPDETGAGSAMVRLVAPPGGALEVEIQRDPPGQAMLAGRSD